MDPDDLITEAAFRGLHLSTSHTTATMKQSLLDLIDSLAGAVIAQHRTLGDIGDGDLLLLNANSPLLQIPSAEMIRHDTEEDKRIGMAETIRCRQLREVTTPE